MAYDVTPLEMEGKSETEDRRQDDRIGQDRGDKIWDKKFQAFCTLAMT